MFENLLTRIGIGGVTVDTRLSKTSYQAKDNIKGVIEVTGGSHEQSVEHIQLVLYKVTRGYRKDSDFDEYQEKIQKIRIDRKITLGEGERFDIPFDFPVSGLPVSDDKHSVRLHTKAILSNSIDAEDEDDIQIIE